MSNTEKESKQAKRALDEAKERRAEKDNDYNQMPVEIEEGDVIEIPKYSYHRLIKGNSKLILQIEEK